MQELFTKTVFTMRPGEACWLHVARAQRLHLECAAGIDVWITIDGRGGDHWLRAGDDLALLAGDRLLVSVQPDAAKPVKLALIAPSRAHQTALRKLGRALRWLRPDKSAPTALNA
ncbi:DUF2917 domain-containing protein [Imbroritus primus]|uniref:DUF2917 domain-containing protein n=1 Tax=Imbroritus primus TaxID=3058603 RepID=A0ACD3SLM7_9BURK|nr:DUF2917 domain-containing protein [Burkholderiaceae bacterium PBA]